MGQVKRKRKAKFRVKQVVMITAEDRPFKIYRRYSDGLEEEFVYENKAGWEAFENQLRPLTARERGGR